MARIFASTLPRQLMFAETCPLSAAIEKVASSGCEMRGAVYTRAEVVNFMLDLAGYVSSADLLSYSLLEPSIGAGDFIIPAVERLLRVWVERGRPDALATLGGCITAVEVHTATMQRTRTRLHNTLRLFGIPESEIAPLSARWLVEGDFLLVPLETQFDFVIGNPPYVRQELISDVLLREYRQRYQTIYDRADLYVPFIERSLSSLKEGGQLAFICSDRWMKNRYGGLLREMVARDFHLKVYIDMVNTDAFQSDVIAYPAITLIARSSPGETRVASQPQINSEALSSLALELIGNRSYGNRHKVKSLVAVTNGSEPWIFESNSEMSLVRRLEDRYPLIEDTGCKVGIGVATGADKVFISDYENLDVESDRKLKLVTTQDINSGRICWNGYGVVNPFDPSGKLVRLEDYPRLGAYFHKHKALLEQRHVAKKSSVNWYRTIDRIWPDLLAQPKLLIPDIKGGAQVVYDRGGFYPHHNLYYITAKQWDLYALQAVLLSGIARIFVSAYSTKMRGGFLRFQAQYLRRIRVPLWHDVSVHLQQQLCEAGRDLDMTSAKAAVAELYDLDTTEQLALD